MEAGLIPVPHTSVFSEKQKGLAAFEPFAAALSLSALAPSFGCTLPVVGEVAGIVLSALLTLAATALALLAVLGTFLSRLGGVLRVVGKVAAVLSVGHDFILCSLLPLVQVTRRFLPRSGGAGS